MKLKKKQIAFLIFLIVGTVYVAMHQEHTPSATTRKFSERIFGTVMNVTYTGTEDLHDTIMTCLKGVDASLSMATGGGKRGRSRLYTGCEAAALMALAASFGGGSVGGVIFDGDILYSHKPKSGGSHALLFLRQLENVLTSSLGIDFSRTGEGGGSSLGGGKNQLGRATVGSSLNKALRGAASLLKKPSLVLVISDFRTAGYQQDLAILSSRHDVITLRITDPVDSQLEGVGSLPFVDPETGYKQVLPTSSPAFQRGWKDADRKRMERWQASCYRRGAVPLQVSTQEDVVVALQRFFSARDS